MNAFALKKTEVFKIDPGNPDKRILERTAEVIRSGGIVVYPTDTLYGFGVDAKNKVAMDRLYELKGRGDQKPVSLIVKNTNHAREIVGDLNEYQINLFNTLLPGKITLILKAMKKIDLPKLNQFRKIGIRIPHNLVCKFLAEMANTPITSTSVNLTGKDSLENANEILKIFNDRVDIILDAGPLKKSIGSTVLDTVTMPPTLLREGDVSITEIQKILGYNILTRYPKKFMIAFVCSGNICRSPMAEGILRKIISESKYKNWVDVLSAGTLNINNSPPTIEAMDVAHNGGINISAHKSQGLSEDIMRRANIIICMALNHIHYIQEKFPQYRSKSILLKQWQAENKLSNPSIADPIGRNLSFYEQIFKEIKMEIHRVLAEIYRQIEEFRKDTADE